MPTLITNSSRKPVLPSQTVSSVFCVSTYEEYLDQREELPDFTQENVKSLTADFKDSVIDPMKQADPDVEMGEYFVIPVAELRRMLDSGDNPDFVHICSALRSTETTNNSRKKFSVSIIVPVKKDVDASGIDIHVICNSANTVFLESYPCPPDPHCPEHVKHQLTRLIFREDQKFNDFSALK